MSGDLIAFLRARLDEDAEFLADFSEPGVQMELRRARSPQHVGGYTIGRQQREVEAKRAILARHAPNPEHPAFCGRCNDGLLEQRWPCPDVLDLIAVYGDHPDYRQEWKP